MPTLKAPLLSSRMGLGGAWTGKYGWGRPLWEGVRGNRQGPPLPRSPSGQLLSPR